MKSAEEIAETRRKREEVKKAKATLSQRPMANKSSAGKSKKRTKSKKTPTQAVIAPGASQPTSPQQEAQIAPSTSPEITPQNPEVSEEQTKMFLQEIKERNKE
jgi:hypothetical protein